MASTHWEKDAVDEVRTLDGRRPDGMYVCCASFEERAVGAARRLATSYRCERSAIFVYDAQEYREDRMRHYKELRETLSARTTRQLDVIPCDKANVFDGVGQFREALRHADLSAADTTVTVDITTFTKLYLLELLYLLSEESALSKIRILYTLPKAYGPGKLSEGARDVITVPHLTGFLPINGNVIMMAFLGFEGERALSIFEEYDPRVTIAIVCDPEYRNGYRKRVETSNSFLLSRPGVKAASAPPYDLVGARDRLEGCYAPFAERQDARPPSVVLAPLGTHMQAVSTFLFWRRHREAHVAYAFPTRYSPSYKQRRAGATLSVDLEPLLAG